jgi:hypothetical protein
MLYLNLWLTLEDDPFQTVGRGCQQLLNFQAAIVVLLLLQILFDPKHQSETCYISPTIWGEKEVLDNFSRAELIKDLCLLKTN